MSYFLIAVNFVFLIAAATARTTIQTLESDAERYMEMHMERGFMGFENWVVNLTGNPTQFLNSEFRNHFVTNRTKYNYNLVDLFVTYNSMSTSGAFSNIFRVNVDVDEHEKYITIGWESLVRLKGNYSVRGIFRDHYVEQEGSFETLSYIFPEIQLTYLVNRDGYIELDTLCKSETEVEPKGLTVFDFEDESENNLLKNLAIFLSEHMATGTDVHLENVESATMNFLTEIIFRKFTYKEMTSPPVVE